MNNEFNIVGKRVVRSDSLAKVTGEARYTADLKFPNMLVAKVLRSPYPHAKILTIDYSKALKVPGVKAAVSGFDSYGIKWGVFRYTQDHAMLHTDKVRYIGEDVAAVAAVDEETALEALSLIKVDLEPLPAVFDPFESMQEGAPQIHDEYKNNINIHIHIDVGEVDKAMEKAFLVRRRLQERVS
jgi:CO/xanthine dehydrogenase Mo-binding subunit